MQQAEHTPWPALQRAAAAQRGRQGGSAIKSRQQNGDQQSLVARCNSKAGCRSRVARPSRQQTGVQQLLVACPLQPGAALLLLFLLAPHSRAGPKAGPLQGKGSHRGSRWPFPNGFRLLTITISKSLRHCGEGLAACVAAVAGGGASIWCTQVSCHAGYTYGLVHLAGAYTLASSSPRTSSSPGASSRKQQ